MSDTESKTTFAIINYDSGIQCKLEYENDILSRETWLKDGKKHKEDNNPAEIVFYENGNKRQEYWYKNGISYRENGLPHDVWYDIKSNIIHEDWESNFPREDDKPSTIFYYESGNKEAELWLICDIGYHRENDKPAMINYYDSFDENGNQIVKSETWYVNNDQYRECDLPSEIEYDEKGFVEVEHWVQNGLFHRDNDQPAEIKYNEQGNIYCKRWFTEGVCQKDERF